MDLSFCQGFFGLPGFFFGGTCCGPVWLDTGGGDDAAGCSLGVAMVWVASVPVEETAGTLATPSLRSPDDVVSLVDVEDLEQRPSSRAVSPATAMTQTP